MAEQEGSSNHGAANQGDQSQQSPSRSPSPMNEGQPYPREEELMLKVTDIFRTTFDQYRKEKKDTGKKKVTSEDTTKKTGFVTFKSFKANGVTDFEGVT